MITKKIKNYFQNNLVICEEKVGTFKSAKSENFSSCNFVGFNFDKIKDKIYNKYYKNKPKSCDILKLFDDRIDFIEFKTLDISEVKDFGCKIGKEYELIKKLEDSYDLLKKIMENEKEFNNKLDLDLLVEIQKLFCISIFFKYSLDLSNGEQFAITGKIITFKKYLESYFKANPVPYGENFIEEPKLFSLNFVSDKIEMIDDFYKTDLL